MIDYRNQLPGIIPCPNKEFPLHHFIHDAKSEGVYQATRGKGESWVDKRYFRCSSSTCSARLTVRVHSPKLRLSWVALLTDRSLIKERAQKVIDAEPARFEGHAVPAPVGILVNLRTYILNATTDLELRPIKSNNKKWLLSLGEPCADLLEYIGFTRQVIVSRSRGIEQY